MNPNRNSVKDVLTSCFDVLGGDEGNGEDLQRRNEENGDERRKNALGHPCVSVKITSGG
jgi:hypothetical protein